MRTLIWWINWQRRGVTIAERQTKIDKKDLEAIVSCSKGLTKTSK
jgi:hypothetical protein